MERVPSNPHTSTKVWDLANAKCRTCDSSADAGAYCNSCAAAIMAKALNPFFGGKRKKLDRPDVVGSPTSLLLNSVCSIS